VYWLGVVITSPDDIFQGSTSAVNCSFTPSSTRTPFITPSVAPSNTYPSTITNTKLPTYYPSKTPNQITSSPVFPSRTPSVQPAVYPTSVNPTSSHGRCPSESGALVIPQSNVSIAYEAYNGCGTITSLVVPSTVTDIGQILMKKYQS
jgi:hypothetical protein